MMTMTTGTVLLAIAKIRLISKTGRSFSVRALLDSASKASFVTERVVQQLALQRRKANVIVSGLQGLKVGRPTQAVSLRIAKSVYLPTAFVLPNLTSFKPGRRICKGNWKHIRKLQLADPEYYKPSAIDVILGTDVYSYLQRDGFRRGRLGEPVTHRTMLGWVLTGTASADTHTSGHIESFHIKLDTDLSRELQRFWELEELPVKRILSPEETYCEELFDATHERDGSGRYTVRLPAKEDMSPDFAESRNGAMRMFLNIEQRLGRNEALRGAYIEFMRTYAELRHMEEIKETKDSKSNRVYYLPHHAVVKKTDPKDKIRVVFNASFYTKDGFSLNNILLPGPKLQSDLWLVLTRWRMFRFAFSTDIVKMFRQIPVHKKDTDLQRILCEDPSDEVREYSFLTVTYGTVSASYLVIRTLLQLVSNGGMQIPARCIGSARAHICG